MQTNNASSDLSSTRPSGSYWHSMDHSTQEAPLVKKSPLSPILSSSSTFYSSGSNVIGRLRPTNSSQSHAVAPMVDGTQEAKGFYLISSDLLEPYPTSRYPSRRWQFVRRLLILYKFFCIGILSIYLLQCFKRLISKQGQSPGKMSCSWIYLHLPLMDCI